MKEILENGYFVINGQDGTSKKYSTLFTFYNKEYKKNYVVYCDYLDDDTEEESDVYASIYNPDDTKFELIEIVDENELNMVQNQIDEVMDSSIQEINVEEGDVFVNE